MPHNVAHFLAEQARLYPDKPAVRAPHCYDKSGWINYTELSFLQLEQEASAVAQILTVKGIQRSTRVLLMVKPGLDLIRIVFALFKIGAVPIIIDPGMGLRGFLRCVRHSKPTAVVGIPLAIWISRLFYASFKAVTVRVTVGRLFARAISKHKVLKDLFSVINSNRNELAAILFTSGSTGPAKGVCYTHGMFAAQVEAIRSQYNIEPGEIDLPMLPVFALFNPALGMCTVVPEMDPSRPASVDPKKIVRAIQQNAVTNSFGSPALWSKIARYCEANQIVLPSVRRILMAGAPVSTELIVQMGRFIPNGEIHTPYGATEALPVSSLSASEVIRDTQARTLQGEGTCVGRPLPGITVKIIIPIDARIATIEQAIDCPKGEIGEIIVKGPTVTYAYDNLQEADAQSKILDGQTYWHRMGDMGWLDAEGRLWFCGRMAERVVTSNYTLYTDCCEAIYNQHEKVFRSALIDCGSNCPGIVIEPETACMPGSDQEKIAFIDSLRALGATVSCTRQIENFFFIASFPVDVRHNAKINRLKLAKKFGSLK